MGTEAMAIRGIEDIMARDLLMLKLKLKLTHTMEDITEAMEDIMEATVVTMEDTGAMDTTERDLLSQPLNHTMDTEAIEDIMEAIEDTADMAMDVTTVKST